ncbi:putative transcriptional regulator, contains C-terminal CBS domains [Archaeoglobus sulfaticallidus PM70-1]|uniref:Putative transcriptional regulator, contains C-terminal CBS domains n=1 Tax=Archaeoglobus sulfaticallidus PM70-1 TaxID=387631 RepID=N0BIM7_9EURY|nr:CBS domain-containing protein [Archaeoglobus sulfaticallidus]AGK60326.1 putative transcriptional regulator, contains C-terminal CBS domains [Archaeoglobus sulfaticallidus PM70-1]
MELELTQIQKDILYALITLYKKKIGLSIKGEEIAELINRNPGTVRNQMQALRALGLVEGVPGPKGGYKPTAKAYELLSVTKPEEAVRVPVIRNDELLEDLSVEELDFPSISHPEVCQARIRVVGDIKKITVGDRILVGPTPVNEMIVSGKVSGRDDTANTIIIDTESIVALPKDTIGEHMSSPLITVDKDMIVRDATKILSEKKIYCAPVKSDGSLIGIFTLEHAVKAIAEDKLDARVEEVMRPKIVTAEKDTKIREAIRLMRDEDVRVLIVTDRGNPIGIITDQKVLTRLLPPFVVEKF